MIYYEDENSYKKCAPKVLALPYLKGVSRKPYNSLFFVLEEWYIVKIEGKKGYLELRTYDYKKYEVYPIPKGVRILYVIHYICPSFQTYHLYGK